MGCRASAAASTETLGVLGRHTIVNWLGWPSKYQHFEADAAGVLLSATNPHQKLLLRSPIGATGGDVRSVNLFLSKKAIDTLAIESETRRLASNWSPNSSDQDDKPTI
jgi:hypothetical protein